MAWNRARLFDTTCVVWLWPKARAHDTAKLLPKWRNYLAESKVRYFKVLRNYNLSPTLIRSLLELLSSMRYTRTCWRCVRGSYYDERKPFSVLEIFQITSYCYHKGFHISRRTKFDRHGEGKHLKYEGWSSLAIRRWVVCPPSLSSQWPEPMSQFVRYQVIMFVTDKNSKELAI